jgi:hypothetical protein
VTVDRGVLILPRAKIKQPINQAITHAKWLRDQIQRRFGLSVSVKAVVALPGWMVNGGFDGECWMEVGAKRWVVCGPWLRHLLVMIVIKLKYDFPGKGEKGSKLNTSTPLGAVIGL